MSAKARITKFLDKISSKTTLHHAIYIFAILFFLVVILVPPILGTALKLNLFMDVVNNPPLMSRALNAIWLSFAVAILVGIIDLVAGIPAAWLIARGKSRWLNVLDTLADLPFIIPTVALGYSLLLFWDSSYGVSGMFSSSLISPGWLLVILLHFVFSFPIVVRVMVGALLDYQNIYEEAARTLGASPVAAERTVTFPILKPSLIGAFVLAFARSISETGATIVVAGTFENGAVFIANMNTPQNQALYGQAPLVFASMLLILIAVILFAIIQILGPRLRFPIRRVSPSFEKKLSSKSAVSLRDGATLLVLFFIILIPALFVIVSAFPAFFDGTLNSALAGTGDWQQYWQSLLLSYFIGFVATLVNVIVGLPMAIMIARKRMGKTVSAVFDVLVNIPIIVPSVALGASLALFWRSFPSVPEMLLIIFAHIAITYPYFVKSLAAAVGRVDFEIENAARILGARPFAVFRTIILPLVKYSFFAGAIIMFTRSVSETGATVAVSTNIKTVPVLLVSWIKPLLTQGGVGISSAVGLGCGFLILFSIVILLLLRFVIRGRGRY